MAISYRQTDTAAPCGSIQACAPVAPAADADAQEAQDGGTAGTTELACDVAAASSELCYADELAILDSDSLDSGTLTARINVTTAQGDLTLEDIYVCRLNSSCTSQETLGSTTGLGVDVSAGGVFSQNITLSAASAHNAGDSVYIAYVFANGHQHSSRTVSITPDQLIDAPFSAGAQTVQESITEAATATETTQAVATGNTSASESATATETATGGLVVSDSLSETATATESATTALTAPRSVTEAATALETSTTTATGSAALTGAATALEAVQDVITGPVSVAETASATETTGGVRLIVDSITEVAEASETATHALTASGATTESATSEDSLALHGVRTPWQIVIKSSNWPGA